MDWLWEHRQDRQFVLTNTVLPVIITPVLYAAYSLFDDEISEVSRKFENKLYMKLLLWKSNTIRPTYQYM